LMLIIFDTHANADSPSHSALDRGLAVPYTTTIRRRSC
jgi:hypothetical protein